MTSLFESLNDLSEVQGLIDSGTRESEVLEYKTASQIFNNADKNEIAKDVSAFANALGGMIVYGVATDKKDKSLPAAIEPIEVTNIETIDRVINSTVYPPISGLKKKLIPKTNPKIMVLDIPASDTPLH
jgi:predicted HTH transcriptional regulator